MKHNIFGDSAIALNPAAECLRSLSQNCQRPLYIIKDASAPRVKTSDYVIKESGSFAL